MSPHPNSRAARWIDAGADDRSRAAFAFQNPVAPSPVGVLETDQPFAVRRVQGQ